LLNPIQSGSQPAGDISHKPGVTACHAPLKTEVTVTQPWRYGAACDILPSLSHGQWQIVFYAAH